MTRINAGIEVVNLIDQHLLAEHREIKRICFLFKQRFDKNDFSDIDCSFYSLKKNDEIAFSSIFYVDKGLWTFNRYREIYLECIRRGFAVTDFSKSWNVYNLKNELYKDWQPNVIQTELIKDRIVERLSSMKNLRFYKRPISNELAINFIIKNNQHGKAA